MLHERSTAGAAKVESLIEGRITQIQLHGALKQVGVEISGEDGVRARIYLDSEFHRKLQLGDAVTMTVFVRDL
jgi:hypothetical protein